jgi:hypothetical protein
MQFCIVSVPTPRGLDRVGSAPLAQIPLRRRNCAVTATSSRTSRTLCARSGGGQPEGTPKLKAPSPGPDGNEDVAKKVRPCRSAQGRMGAYQAPVLKQRVRHRPLLHPLPSLAPFSSLPRPSGYQTCPLAPHIAPPLAPPPLAICCTGRRAPRHCKLPLRPLPPLHHGESASQPAQPANPTGWSVSGEDGRRET